MYSTVTIEVILGNFQYSKQKHTDDNQKRELVSVHVV